MRTSATRTRQTSAEHPASEPLATLIESNLAEYWLSLGAGPDGQVCDSEFVRWAYSGGPYFNRVVAANLNESNADGIINEIARAFRDRRAAITWLTGPSSQPIDIGARLQRHGFMWVENWTGMVHHLEDADSRIDPFPGIEVREVHDDATHRDWMRVVCRSFELPSRACNTLRQKFSIQSNPGVWYHNLAYLKGAPVAATTLFVKNGTAGIYLVSTVPEQRGKGLGTQMTRLALRQAKELGCDQAVLQATNAGQRMYEGLGFRPVCEIGVYRLAAPSPVWRRTAGTFLRMLRLGMRRVSMWRARLISLKRAPNSSQNQDEHPVELHAR